MCLFMLHLVSQMLLCFRLSYMLLSHLLLLCNERSLFSLLYRANDGSNTAGKLQTNSLVSLQFRATLRSPLPCNPRIPTTRLHIREGFISKTNVRSPARDQLYLQFCVNAVTRAYTRQQNRILRWGTNETTTRGDSTSRERER